MENVLKVVEAVAPFLAQYPAWVKTLFTAWSLLTATLFVGLILARSPNAGSRGEQNASSSRPANQGSANHNEKSTAVSAKPEEAIQSDKTSPGNAETETWLMIDGVELYSGTKAEIRITADVNGTQYKYPSKAGIQWLEVGPGMAGQVFHLPPMKGRYIVRFEGEVRHPPDRQQIIQYKSVQELIIDEQTALPYKGEYVLYGYDPTSETRSGRAEAYVKLRMSHSPH